VKYNKKSISGIPLAGRRVLLRCDFNVPLDKECNITDDTRITAALPTIKYVLEHGGSAVLCSHLGRPKGANPELSLAPVAKRLGEYLGMEVKMAPDCIGVTVKAMADRLKPGEVMLLENLRFHKEEEKNDPEFARELASLADIYVSDAFGTVHRAHASTAGVADYLPAYCGFLIEAELKAIGGALENPKRPLLAILGGAKVSDKLAVLDNLIEKADVLLIGGGMAFTFIRAIGGKIGKSLVDEDKIPYIIDMMVKANARDVEIILPKDVLAAAEFSAAAPPFACDADNIPDGMMGLDIGEKTCEMFEDEIARAGTVIWNGPMGVFEFDAYAKGTEAVAKAMAECRGVTVIGGGDSVAAVTRLGLADKMTHISTGGGASLEFMEGKDLPGIACLLDADE
jgi:phosphoglycerate kinase